MVPNKPYFSSMYLHIVGMYPSETFLFAKRYLLDINIYKFRLNSNPTNNGIKKICSDIYARWSVSTTTTTLLVGTQTACWYPKLCTD